MNERALRSRGRSRGGSRIHVVLCGSEIRDGRFGRMRVPIARPLGRLSVVTRLAFRRTRHRLFHAIGGDSTDLAGDCKGQFRPFGGVKPISPSIAHRFENYPLLTLAIPLAVKDALPRAEVEPTGGHGHDHLVSHGDRSQMSRRVVLAGSTVVAIPIWLPRRDRLLEPIEDILPQPRLVIVDKHRGRDVHRRHEHHAFLDRGGRAAFLDGLGDVDDLLPLFRVECEVVCVRFHRRV